MRFFFYPGAPVVSFWASAVNIVSVVVDFLRTRTLRKAAADHESSVQASDADHFANDMLGAVAVLLGLAVVALADPLHLPNWLSGAPMRSPLWWLPRSRFGPCGIWDLKPCEH